MEPFGLFQILQSFLGQNPENVPKAEQSNTSESETRLEESAPPPEKANPQSDPLLNADSSNQAILSFMQAHETRARRIKKL